MDELLEEIIGIFKHCIYKSDSFMVTKFQSEDDLITVTGPYFNYEKGSKYILKGVFFEHYKYGYQFKYQTIEKAAPKEKDEIINFLSSSLFKGIGKKTAEKIYSIFKDDAITLIKNDINILDNLNLSNKQYKSLKEGFASLNDPLNEALFYLLSNGFSNIDAQKIIATFKLDTIKVSEDNPFRYYTEVYGIGFDKVKSFAERKEFDNKEAKFKEAYLIYLLNDYTFNFGDTYIEEALLIELLEKNEIYDIDDLLMVAKEHKYIYIEDNRIYLYRDYQNENIIADYLNNFGEIMLYDKDYLINKIDDLASIYNIIYDNKQKDAILNFFDNIFSLIIGGPGTGKTTIIKSMVNLFKQIFPFNNIIVVAPTGRAAKRIAEICEVESKTIHSLLKWNKETNTFIFNEENQLLYDAIIVDEFSMVDADLFASLLKASKRIKKLCLIGDDNQLPSIRQGAVLRDLINTNSFSLIRLDVNFRQKEGSDIIKLASDVIKQNINFDDLNKEVTFIENNIKDNDLIDFINEDLLNDYDIDDIQVLTPMYKGKLGIDNLNNILQEAYNPRNIHTKEKEIGKQIFRLNDKVIQLKNRPNDDVYNGDVGRIIDIDLKEKNILVNYQDVFLYYNYDELNEISLAYAMSVHKSQGSEYQVVYLILSPYNIHMLSKNLIYTAITRAKKKLVIISSKDLLLNGINKNQEERKTTLVKRILSK